MITSRYHDSLIAFFCYFFITINPISHFHLRYVHKLQTLQGTMQQRFVHKKEVHKKNVFVLGLVFGRTWLDLTDFWFPARFQKIVENKQSFESAGCHSSTITHMCLYSGVDIFGPYLIGLRKVDQVKSTVDQWVTVVWLGVILTTLTWVYWYI